MKNSKKSGSGTDNIYTLKLWCFNYLSFLNDDDSIRQSVSNMQSDSSHPPDHSSSYPTEEILDNFSDSEVCI